MLSLRYSLALFYSFEFEQNVRNTTCLVYPVYPIRRQDEGEFFHFLFKSNIEMNSKTIVRQVAGIDVAQNELVVSLGRRYDDFNLDLYANKVFANNEKGFEAFISWVRKLTQQTTDVIFVMEATGVYHEKFAYFLHGKGFKVSIVLPNKISNYQRTLEVKTITDKTSAAAIARFGLERNLDGWNPPKKIYRRMRQLTREREQIVEERTMVKNQLHAEESEAFPNKATVKRLKEKIKLLDKHEKQVKKELAELIKQDQSVKENIELICSIPGIGMTTAATVLAETNGFELIRNRKQLTSYAGMDVKEKESGTSVRGKAKISKRGNKYLRKALHMPTFCVIKNNERFKAIYQRLVSKHGIKMKAAVAVQRKVLELIYTLYKTGNKYDPEYFKSDQAVKTDQMDTLKKSERS